MKFLKQLQKKFQNRFNSNLNLKSKSHIVAAILFALPFLPIIPYLRTNDAIYLFGVIEGSTDNFYEIPLGILEKEPSYESPSKFDEGRALFDLGKLANDYDLHNPTKHKKYLIKEGMSEEIASCISMRDFLFIDYFFQIENAIIKMKWKPSPVPIVWFIRSSLLSWVLDAVSIPASDFEFYEKLSKKCSKYENIFPPKGILKEDFSFPIDTKLDKKK